MSDRTGGNFRISQDFWCTPEVAEAFTRTDVAQLIRLVQKHTGASQTQVGTAVGLAQPKISDLTTPHRSSSSSRLDNRSIAVMRRIAHGLQMPRDVAAAFLLGDAPVPRPDVDAPPFPSDTQGPLCQDLVRQDLN